MISNIHIDCIIRIKKELICLKYDLILLKEYFYDYSRFRSNYARNHISIHPTQEQKKALDPKLDSFRLLKSGSHCFCDSQKTE